VLRNPSGVGAASRAARVVLAATLAASLLVGACAKRQSETVVARVGKGKVTLEQMNARLQSIPPQAAAQFEGEEGRKRFLDGFIEEETWYQAAIDAKVDQDEEVRRQIDDAVRRILIENYFARELQPYMVLTEEDLRKSYETHIADYTKPREMKVRHVLASTKEQAEGIRRRLERGEDMEKLAREISTDEYTKKDGGLIGYVAEHSTLIPYVGNSKEMTAAIDSLPLMRLSKVIHSPRGFHVLRVEEIVPEAPLPFEKMKEVIRRQEQPAHEAKVRAERLEELKKRLGVTIVQKGLEADASARADEAERLFKEAQESKDWQTRLDLYNEFLRRFPDHAHNYEAKFMIGFIYAEELKDYAKAQEAFWKLLKEHPDCELADDAKFMLDNLGLQTPPAPHDDGASTATPPATPSSTAAGS
jgi:peptidyl-prolyl cis-trans isomerase C